MPPTTLHFLHNRDKPGGIAWINACRLRGERCMFPTWDFKFGEGTFTNPSFEHKKPSSSEMSEESIKNPHDRLFKDDADRERFLDRLAERVEQYHIRLYLSPSAWQCASRCGSEVLDSVLGTEPARGGRNPRSRDGIGSL